MFQIEPILWLQGLQLPGLYPFLWMVTQLGYGWIYTLAFFCLAFGFRLRPLLGVSLALMLAAAATDGMKEGFALPRPNDVDARVLKTGKRGTHLVENGAGAGFLELPAAEAIATKRVTGEAFGFPSGHASAAAAFFISLALLLGARRRWVWILAIAWPVLMALSRMYLGRHFLADALAGLAIGGLSAVFAWALMSGWAGGGNRARLAWAGAAAWLVSLCLLAWASPWVEPGKAGELLGMLTCIAVTERFGLPDESGGPVRRIARVACALVFCFGMIRGLDALYAAGGWPEEHVAGLFFTAIGTPLVILGAVQLLRMLRLYRARPAPDPIRSA